MLTSDQDWTPAWAMQSFLEKNRDIPVHVFRTNPCPIADEAFKLGKITQGWHPNLLPGSSHGNSPEDVVQYMKKHFPGCNTARNHTYLTNTHFDRLLFRSGIRADSQIATHLQNNLFPLNDISGITRFPVFFEDDIFFDNESPSLNLDKLIRSLFSPGLKVFNLHATFFACNTPNPSHYSRYKNKIFDSVEPSSGFVYKDRGSQTVFLEIKKLVIKNGGRFQCFQEFVNKYLDESRKI